MCNRFTGTFNVFKVVLIPVVVVRPIDCCRGQLYLAGLSLRELCLDPSLASNVEAV